MCDMVSGSRSGVRAGAGAIGNASMGCVRSAKLCKGDGVRLKEEVRTYLW